MDVIEGSIDLFELCEFDPIEGKSTISGRITHSERVCGVFATPNRTGSFPRRESGTISNVRELKLNHTLSKEN